jgi:3-keto-5-aminohexanoate cleavage enzyme
MSTPCIITVAITGSVPQKSDNPAVPITINEQIESTHAAFEAGATIAHLHVRKDDGTPSSDPDRFAALQDGLRQHCPGMIVQFSTGGRSGKGSERGGMLVHRPDMASLSTGSCNFPSIVYENHPDLIRELAGKMREYDVKPEIGGRRFATSTRATGARLCLAQAVGRFPAEISSQPLRPHDARARGGLQSFRGQFP